MESLESRSSPEFAPVRERSRLLTAAEVSERLRVPISWVRKHGAELPGIVRLGKYIRWDSARLNEFVAGGGLG